MTFKTIITIITIICIKFNILILKTVKQSFKNVIIKCHILIDNKFPTKSCIFMTDSFDFSLIKVDNMHELVIRLDKETKFVINSNYILAIKIITFR